MRKRNGDKHTWLAVNSLQDNKVRRTTGMRKIFIALNFLTVLLVGCGGDKPLSKPLDSTSHPFAIYWPPSDPAEAERFDEQPLLRGRVKIVELRSNELGRELQIMIEISRPSTESSRQFWNSRLAFGDVPWMDQVRVWDAESQWQWPNLPYLLRRHGEERVERYGGIDPDKGVDNDFAAVLIRQFDEAGINESNLTRQSPLVSAEWHGTGQTPVSIHSVVHEARSDSFVVNMGHDQQRTAGRLKLWLIYADFLGSRPPLSWPKENEWAGGILAYCEIVWKKPVNESIQGTVQFSIPPKGTEFDWASWSDGTPDQAEAKLTTSTR